MKVVLLFTNFVMCVQKQKFKRVLLEKKERWKMDHRDERVMWSAAAAGKEKRGHARYKDASPSRAVWRAAGGGGRGES
jgi:hypothetical protein